LPGQTSSPNNKGKDKKQVVQVRQGRVNFTTLSELPEGAPIMTGTFSINHQPMIILFDSGATHSFISSKCGTRVGLDFYPTKGAYMIATPGGKISSNQVCRCVPIQLGRNLVKIDLLLLDLKGIDILLGMDWMTTILYLPQRECNNSCAYAVEGIKLKDIPIVCEYLDIFPDDLPGMPRTGILSFSQTYNPAQPPSLRGPIVCHPLSWQS
jgi:hypothetical protein